MLTSLANLRLSIVMFSVLAAATAVSATAPPLTIVALGTSLTKDGGWLEALEEDLLACAGRPVRAVNLGGSGQTSEWGRAQIERVVAARPDVLLIEFAINDAHLLKGVSRAQAGDNIRAIATAVRARVPDVRVIFLSLNPVHGLRGWLRPRYSLYSDDYGALAGAIGAEWVDMRPAWRASGLDLRDAIPDGVHPTQDAARGVVVANLLPSLRPNLLAIGVPTGVPSGCRAGDDPAARCCPLTADLTPPGTTE